MSGPIASVTIVAGLVLAAWSLVLLIVNRPPGRVFVGALALLEVAVVVFAVTGVVQLVGRTTDFARLEFVLYLVGCVALLPAAWWWVKDEKSRAAAGVLLVACLVLPFLVVRVQQVWDGAGA